MRLVLRYLPVYRASSCLYCALACTLCSCVMCDCRCHIALSCALFFSCISLSIHCFSMYPIRIVFLSCTWLALSCAVLCFVLRCLAPSSCVAVCLSGAVLRLVSRCLALYCALSCAILRCLALSVALSRAVSRCLALVLRCLALCSALRASCLLYPLWAWPCKSRKPTLLLLFTLQELPEMRMPSAPPPPQPSQGDSFAELNRKVLDSFSTCPPWNAFEACMTMGKCLGVWMYVHGAAA